MMPSSMLRRNATLPRQPQGRPRSPVCVRRHARVVRERRAERLAFSFRVMQRVPPRRAGRAGAEVTRRDPNLTHLRTVLDPEALKRALHTAPASEACMDVIVDDVRYKPGTTCVVAARASPAANSRSTRPSFKAARRRCPIRPWRTLAALASQGPAASRRPASPAANTLESAFSISRNANVRSGRCSRT